MKKFFVVLSVAFVLIIIVAAILFAEPLYKNIQDTEPYPFYNGPYNLIAHGGGAIDGKVYSNSLEAVEESINAGMKFVEIDLIKTSDGKYISGHDWKLFNDITDNTERGDEPMSFAEAKKAKIHGEYTVMDEKDIIALMEKYPDWVLLIDKARDIEHLAEVFAPYRDRVILQVYGLIGYARALRADVKYPTLRLKGGRRGVKEIYKVFMDWMNVKSVILGEKSFEKNLDYIGELHAKGTTVILYGNPRFKIVENPTEIKKYLNKYIDLVDTDTLRSLD